MEIEKGKRMKVLFAPLEGITGYIYRNAHAKYFGGIYRYYAPFLAASRTKELSAKEKNDILPEHNLNLKLIPQILTCDAQSFLRAADILGDFGYEEVNLNLGCPSATVTTKGKGAGFLKEPEKLHLFLEEIYKRSKIRISIKTRIGIEEPEEFTELLSIFNEYPLTELIIHPRLLKDYYKNHPHLETFEYAFLESKNPVVYNGDLIQTEDMNKLQERFPKLRACMIGRGLIRNPDLAVKYQNGKVINSKVFREFHQELVEEYRKTLSGERDVLFKLKEIWNYMLPDDKERILKKIRKCQHLSEFETIVEPMFTVLSHESD